MSTSDLYRINKTGARHVAEFRNGHGTAPLIWGYLNQQFLGREPNAWLFGNNDALWKLSSDDRVPRDVRITHAWCMDGAICPPDRLEELRAACAATGKICGREQHVNHWQAISEAIAAYKPRRGERGLGISCTSVSDPWIDFPRSGYRGEPWSLFDALTT